MSCEPDPAPNYESWTPNDAIAHIQSEAESADFNLAATIRTCNLPPTSPDATTDLECAPTTWSTDDRDHVVYEPIPIQPDAPRVTLPYHENMNKDRTTKKLMRKAMSQQYVPHTSSFRLHIDGGANISITNNEHLLINYKNIKRQPIAGVSDAASALHATGIGYLPGA
mmetsp:Transcript_4433/g.6563  ORF Transcript_4433/g.6563 Transcript_4433/m.6563 type:complete len:168 (+) Transcript_4433:429-932(+)